MYNRQDIDIIIKFFSALIGVDIIEIYAFVSLMSKVSTYF